MVGAGGKVGNGVQQCAVEVENGKALGHGSKNWFIALRDIQDGLDSIDILYCLEFLGILDYLESLEFLESLEDLGFVVVIPPKKKLQFI